MWVQVDNVNILFIGQLIFLFIYLVNHGLIVNNYFQCFYGSVNLFLFLKNKINNNNISSNGITLGFLVNYRKGMFYVDKGNNEMPASEKTLFYLMTL